MFRKFFIVFMCLLLSFSTVACGSREASQPQNQNFSTTSTQTRLSDGKYPVQQATYDDGNGEYTVMLLNTPPGTPAVHRTTDLQMARLTDEEIKAGEKTYLTMNNGQAVMHLTENFKIEYVHNVAETRTDPQTGQAQTVIVRRESNFWTPFAGALAGQAIGSMLFRPQYYVPPVYQTGGSLTGFGGYGSSYNQAIQRYESRYQSPPPAVRNRQALRTTGRLRSPSANRPTAVRRVPSSSSRSSGSGYGSSNLRQSNKSRPSRVNRSPSFGSGSRSRPSRSGRSFGSRRR